MAEPLHILIIDDDDVDRLTLKRSLKNAGLNVRTAVADTAAAGLEKFRQEKFDCIFIDFKLPDLDGLELLQQIREEDALVPVVLITSYGDERVAAEAIKLGASDYISKALLTPEGVSHSLRSTIRLSQAERLKKSVEEQFQATQERLHTVVNNTPIVVWEIDENDCFVIMEGKGLEQLGIKPEDAIGKNMYEVFPDSPSVTDNIRKALNNEVNSATVETQGYCYQTLYQVITDDQGKVTGLSGISFEITDRVKSERTLQKAKDLAEDSVKIKEQFFANMSHEIRTPMNGIMGLTEVLLKMEMTDEQRTYLDAIRTSSERLLVIINDLLDFSKMEAGKLTLHETGFNLRQLIADTVELLSSQAKDRNNRLKVIIDSEIPEEVVGDQVRLSQILTNLIGNAIKFTENGQIRILADLVNTTEEDVLVEFEVQDTGIGIPEDKLASIFESFTQASNETTRKYGGTGLGLTITRQLVEMQGGKLTVRSRVGEGSTFRFALKFKTASEKASGTREIMQEIDPAELGKVRVLLAEDNEINQMLARKVITDWGFELDVASNGRIAVEMLKEKDYDVVLMDMQMPEMDGYEATVYIRNEMGPKSNIPIIAFTAHATKMEIGKCMLAGANAYVSKPLKPAELLNEIYDQVSKEPGVVFKPSLEPEAEEKPEQLSDIKIDLTFLKEMAGGNQVFMNEIVDMFISSTPESLAKMQEAIAENDWINVKAIAHKLKSSMFLVGIKELEMNMVAIEQNAGNPAEQHLVQRLLDRTRRICEFAIPRLKAKIEA
ncbi:response regulator [Adhaeribacter soli]|uniref:Sensory/regulatory protein RpfC n=1 Tax=Adhaeribacter soli TaxID=2607655 RepID=A0A5N1J5E5_9BACT|nr:response regulator [Adhaeribacter soli]KAA9346126.1 response regulator [Adhaeribacter soli]